MYHSLRLQPAQLFSSDKKDIWQQMRRLDVPRASRWHGRGAMSVQKAIWFSSLQGTFVVIYAICTAPEKEDRIFVDMDPIMFAFHCQLKVSMKEIMKIMSPETMSQKQVRNLVGQIKDNFIFVYEN